MEACEKIDYIDTTECKLVYSDNVDIAKEYINVDDEPLPTSSREVYVK